MICITKPSGTFRTLSRTDVFDLCSLSFLLFLPCPVRNGVGHMFQVIPASQTEATAGKGVDSNNLKSAE